MSNIRARFSALRKKCGMKTHGSTCDHLQVRRVYGLLLKETRKSSNIRARYCVKAIQESIPLSLSNDICRDWGALKVAMTAWKLRSAWHDLFYLTQRSNQWGYFH